MPIKATNNYIFIVRDEEKSEVNGLLLPPSGVVKPHTGTIFSVGGKVTDPDIRNSVGRTALFHQTVGFAIEEEESKYFVLQEHEIIAIKK